MNISQLDVEEQIINIRNTHVILDSDIATLYGVETRDINKAVKNNPDKFPENYIIQLNKREKNELVENFHRFNGLKHSTVNPKAFTEKGLYMLATILKSPKATETTLAIIETFTKVREISCTIKAIPQTPQNSPKYQELMQKTGDLISDLVVPDDLDTSETEASIEVNLAIVKFKYSVKKKNK
ncbi:ORF6N domain-containing protein [Legionella rowbothamii]|uniref:ORF6N domain-containing protein n=1 Tax=Legionella rowbothamii TaxID=96229 RepID=UPI001055B1D8|nr:ORF6N domain-containing protein [Legionella rowbothamii]